MSYSRSPQTLMKIIESYAPLLRGESCVWRAPVDTHSPDAWAMRWSYKLREGLYVAKLHPARFPELAEAAQYISISPKPDQGMVVATITRAVGEVTQTSMQTAPRLVPESSEKAKTLQDVLADWERVRSSGQKLHYAAHSLSHTELVELSSKLSAEGWMVLGSKLGTLTIALDNPDVPAEARISTVL